MCYVRSSLVPRAPRPLSRFGPSVLDSRVHARQLGADDVGDRLREKPLADRGRHARGWRGLRLRGAERRGPGREHGGVFLVFMGQGDQAITTLPASFCCVAVAVAVARVVIVEEKEEKKRNEWNKAVTVTVGIAVCTSDVVVLTVGGMCRLIDQGVELMKEDAV